MTLAALWDWVCCAFPSLFTIIFKTIRLSFENVVGRLWLSVTAGMLRMWVLCTQWEKPHSYLVLRNKKQNSATHWFFLGDWPDTKLILRNLRDPAEGAFFPWDSSSAESPFLGKIYAHVCTSSFPKSKPSLHHCNHCVLCWKPSSQRLSGTLHVLLLMHQS